MTKEETPLEERDEIFKDRIKNIKKIVAALDERQVAFNLSKRWTKLDNQFRFIETQLQGILYQVSEKPKAEETEK
jgi:hypothetical protein